MLSLQRWPLRSAPDETSSTTVCFSPIDRQQLNCNFRVSVDLGVKKQMDKAAGLLVFGPLLEQDIYNARRMHCSMR